MEAMEKNKKKDIKRINGKLKKTRKMKNENKNKKVRQ